MPCEVFLLTCMTLQNWTHMGLNMAIYRNRHNPLKDVSLKIMHNGVWPKPPKKKQLPTSAKNFSTSLQWEHGAGITLWLHWLRYGTGVLAIVVRLPAKVRNLLIFRLSRTNLGPTWLSIQGVPKVLPQE